MNGRRKMALIALLLASGCLIDSNPLVRLGVNWFPEAKPFYCVPASIQMWAIYDSMPIDQDTIANAVGFVPFQGVPALNVAPGVNRFTRTKDAVLQNAFYGGPVYFSNQITSINNGRPFLGVFDVQHVVAVDGGNWNYDGDTGLYVWDEVLFHDPQSSHPDSTMSAGDWLTLNTDHVISASATAGADGNLKTYGGDVLLRGSGYRYHPPAV